MDTYRAGTCALALPISMATGAPTRIACDLIGGTRFRLRVSGKRHHSELEHWPRGFAPAKQQPKTV